MDIRIEIYYGLKHFTRTRLHQHSPAHPHIHKIMMNKQPVLVDLMAFRSQNTLGISNRLSCTTEKLCGWQNGIKKISGKTWHQIGFHENWLRLHFELNGKRANDEHFSVSLSHIAVRFNNWMLMNPAIRHCRANGTRDRMFFIDLSIMFRSWARQWMASRLKLGTCSHSVSFKLN